MATRNPFQQAVVELNCQLNGYYKPDGSPDAATLKALGGGRLIRFLKDKAEECKDGDEDGAVQLSVAGFGHVDGSDLDDAVAKMSSKLSAAGFKVPAATAKK